MVESNPLMKGIIPGEQDFCHSLPAHFLGRLRGFNSERTRPTLDKGDRGKGGWEFSMPKDVGITEPNTGGSSRRCIAWRIDFDL